MNYMPFMYIICIMHVICMFCTCIFHLLCMHITCTAPKYYMYYACKMHVNFIHILGQNYSCIIHAQGLVYCMNNKCILHICIGKFQEIVKRDLKNVNQYSVHGHKPLLAKWTKSTDKGKNEVVLRLMVFKKHTTQKLPPIEWPRGTFELLF